MKIANSTGYSNKNMAEVYYTALNYNKNLGLKLLALQHALSSATSSSAFQ